MADYEAEYKNAPLAPHGGCNWRECKECFPHEETRNRMEQEEIKRAIKFLTDAGFTITKDGETYA